MYFKLNSVVTVLLDFEIVFCFDKMIKSFSISDEMLTQHENDNVSSQKSCYSRDNNATVSVLQRYLVNNANSTSTMVSSSRVQHNIPTIKVEPSTKEFLAQHFHDVRTS